GRHPPGVVVSPVAPATRATPAYDLSAVVAEVAGAGCCRHPVRLFASRLDRRTGELSDRTVVVACKDRRAVLCPACAAVYQADAWQLVAAGLRGGKGVPHAVADHLACFVTLTAPSFGAVHTRPTDGRSNGVCHRRRPGRCPHGLLFGCDRRHEAGDPLLGRPICPGCFEYEAAVLWNASVSLLWQRTSVAVAREVARAGGLPVRQLGTTLRLSYLKVVEFQRRGLAHLHVVVRADGPAGPGDLPPAWLGPDLLVRAITDAAGRVTLPDPRGTRPGRPGSSGVALRTIGWGIERSVRVLADRDPEAVAAYVAKYATKTAIDHLALARRLDGQRSDRRAEPVLAGVDPHLAALARTAWRLGGRRDLAGLNLRAHAHTFGYRGHFATKSRRYSTTFGALRQARADHARRLADERAGAGERVGVDEPEESWRYAGRGYGTPAAERLAEVLADGIATRPQRVLADTAETLPAGGRKTSPASSPAVPHVPDQDR
ncbi:MAG TPA: replication initiator, partial [Acidimicrobiales bacterium]|nr:replication initiator [Acidimicrobiales bacterium]